MAFKIALSAGHGRNTAGKRCLKSLDPKETREWVLNSRIADKVENLLKNYSGYELLRLDDRSGLTDVSLSKRSQSANKFKANFYLAIHANAGVNGGKGGGIMAFVYTSPSAESLEWQKDLYNELIAQTGLKGDRSMPLSKANLHECREPYMPAVLLELGFMDSSTDIHIILTEKFADQCAKAIVSVIVKKGKLVKKNNSSVSSKNVSYKVRVTVDALNIRDGAGTNYKINGCITDKGVYTIVEEKDGFLKLKSGAGWISANYTKRFKVKL